MAKSKKTRSKAPKVKVKDLKLTKIAKPAASSKTAPSGKVKGKDWVVY